MQSCSSAPSAGGYAAAASSPPLPLRRDITDKGASCGGTLQIQDKEIWETSMPRSFAVSPARATYRPHCLRLRDASGSAGDLCNRPILLTHGFAAGGNGDVVSRIVGEAIAPRLGQPVVIEPRPGAGGNTASARLVKSEPDGYTLINLTGGHAVSAAIYKSLPFDPVDDFQFVSAYGYQAFMIAVKKGNQNQTIADLIAAAKAAPGRLTYSSVAASARRNTSQASCSARWPASR